MSTPPIDHPATLRQIVTDMHRLYHRTLSNALTDPEDLRNDIGCVAAAVRALAELLLAQQPSGQDGANLAPTLIRPARQNGGVK